MAWPTPGRVKAVARALGVALLLGPALAACGGGGATVAAKPAPAHAQHHVQPHVDVYAGLPLSGPMAPQGRAILKGIRLALTYAHPHPGDLHIRFTKLDDSGRKTGNGNLKLTATNAERVAFDPRAVYYIGDVGSAEATISLPILDAAGIAQVTPGDPYIAPPESQSGSAAPAQRLLRLLPDYTVQAQADMRFFEEVLPRLKEPECTRVLTVAQSDEESAALVNAMYTYAKADGIAMPKPTILTSKANSLTLYLASLHQPSLQAAASRPCGFVIAGTQTKSAVALAKMIHVTFPQAFILGTSGLCTPSSKWTKAAVHGPQAISDSLLWCTSPVLPIADYEGSDGFLQLYKTMYRVSNPSPYAFYGYEAAELGIEIIDDLGPDGDSRVSVRDDLLDANFRDSFFNPYGSVAGTGDSTTSTYGVYRVNPATAEPTLYTILRP